MIDQDRLKDAEFNQWVTDSLEIQPKALYKFAFELFLKDASTKYYYVPDKKLSDQFIKEKINYENLQKIYI